MVLVVFEEVRIASRRVVAAGFYINGVSLLWASAKLKYENVNL
jgi:hypothetical protein